MSKSSPTTERRARPKRIQRRRTKGWRMPEGARYVGRPTDYGNPYKIGSVYRDFFTGGDFVITPSNSLELYEIYAKGKLAIDPQWLEPLLGKDLACWCPLPEPGQPDRCHAAILLRLSNSEEIL